MSDSLPSVARWRMVVLAVLVSASCRRDPPAVEPVPARTAESEGVQPNCRDWSRFDRAGLEPLADGEYASLLDQVWWRVLETHYDPTLGCRPWLELRQTYARRLAEVSTASQAYAQINALLDELGQSHIRLFSPERAEDTPGPAAPDLELRWIHDELVVVRSEAEGLKGRVRPGMTVVAIDDQPIEAIVDTLRAQTEPAAMPRQIARTMAARLSCDRAGQTHTLWVGHTGEGTETSLRVVPCLVPPGERVSLGNLRNIPTRVESRRLNGGVGVIAFNVWMLPMMAQIRHAMQELRGQGMTALVIDLRGNPGGVGAMSVPVARLILPSGGTLGTLRFREFEQTLHVEPNADAFAGPVVVLIDEATASTSEIFVLGLHDLQRITVLGARASAGAALPSILETMQTGAVLQYVVADYRSPRGSVAEGRGITPDRWVVETRADFEQGRDPVLEAAVAQLLEPGALAAETPAGP